VTVSTFAGRATIPGNTDGPAAQASFRDLRDIFLEPSTGIMYIPDTNNLKVRRVMPNGTVSTYAGSGGIGNKNGPAANASFSQLTSVVMDSKKNLYVSDGLNYCIRKIDAAGNVTTFAGSGRAIYQDGTGTGAAFRYVNGLAVDKNDNIYLAEGVSGRIRKIDPAGVVTTFAGNGKTNTVTPGIGTAAAIGYPTNLVFDPNGNLYAASNHCIVKIAANGAVSIFAGVMNGPRGSLTWKDGPASTAIFHYPAGLASDAVGNIYVADKSNFCIRKITQAGVVSTIAGVPRSSGYGDGAGASAKFNNPCGIAVTFSGDIYVSDGNNHCIRKIVGGGPSASEMQAIMAPILASQAQILQASQAQASQAQASQAQAIAVRASAAQASQAQAIAVRASAAQASQAQAIAVRASTAQASMAVVSQAQASSALHESMKASAAQAFQASGARLAAIATQPATQLIQGCSQENDVLGCIDSINKIKTEQELKASQAQTV
jgi:hypothetical protein